MRPKRPALPFALALLLGSFALAVALVSQHRFGMEPCAWCVLQRLVFAAIVAAALLGLAWRRPLGARVAGASVFLLGAAGIGAATWQHVVASKSASCNLTLADRLVGWTTLNERLPDVFEARASCADAAVSLLGVSYDLWALAAFAICVVLAGVALRRAAAYSTSP